MKLVDLLSGTAAEMTAAVKSTEINGVTRDSRQVTKRDLFVAVPELVAELKKQASA